LLEYANTQLLEFRHYDELPTGVLAEVYRSIDKGTGMWRRRLVDQKLQTAGELCEYMVDRFDSGRGFFLEMVVVIILPIEIVFLFRGKG
jgi:hypothetical protein